MSAPGQRQRGAGALALALALVTTTLDQPRSLAAPAVGRRIGDADERIAAVAADGAAAAMVRDVEGGSSLRVVDLRHGQVSVARAVSAQALFALADGASVLVVLEPASRKLVRAVPFARDAAEITLPAPADVEALAIDAGAGHLAMAARQEGAPPSPRAARSAGDADVVGAGVGAGVDAGPWACVHVVRPRAVTVVQRCRSLASLRASAGIDAGVGARVALQQVAYARDGRTLWWAISLLRGDGGGAVVVVSLNGDSLAPRGEIALPGGLSAGLRAWPGGGGADVQLAVLGAPGASAVIGAAAGAVAPARHARCDALVSVRDFEPAAARAALTALAWPIAAGEAAAGGPEGVRFGVGHVYAALASGPSTADDAAGADGAGLRALHLVPYAPALPAATAWRVADDTRHAAARFGQLAVALDDSGPLGIFEAAEIHFAGADRLLFRGVDGGLRAAGWSELGGVSPPPAGLDVVHIAAEVALRLTTRCR